MMDWSGALAALKLAAFEERVNRDRKAADWWRGRAALSLRRLAKAKRFARTPVTGSAMQ